MDREFDRDDGLSTLPGWPDSGVFGSGIQEALSSATKLRSWHHPQITLSIEKTTYYFLERLHFYTGDGHLPLLRPLSAGLTEANK